MGKPFSSALELKHLATPSGNPPSGAALLYVKSDGKVYTKSSTGVETAVDTAAGGPTNMVTTDTTQTITGAKTFNAIPLLGLQQGVLSSAQLTAASLRLYHDRLRFSSPTYETSPDNTTWTVQAAPAGRTALAGRSDSTVDIPVATPFVRWTWGSGSGFESWTQISRLLLKFGYVSPGPTVTVNVWTSTDGVTWTPRITNWAITNASANQWASPFGDPGSDTWLRLQLSITGGPATGNICRVNGIEFQTPRWGDQGSSPHREEPYWWAYDKAIGFYNRIQPMSDAAYDLGVSGTNRFRDLYLSGNVEADALRVPDTRAVSTTPASYSRQAKWHFKTASAVGLPGGVTYALVNGVRGWTGTTGDLAHEVAYCDNGHVYRRVQTSVTDTATWGAWVKVQDKTQANVFDDDARLTDARTPTAHSHATNLDALTDVAITTATSGHVLTFNGTEWVNATPDAAPVPVQPAEPTGTPEGHLWYDSDDETSVDLDTSDVVTGVFALARLPVAPSGTSSATELVRADDARLSDSRAPTSHTHPNTEITGLGTASTKNTPAAGDAAATEAVLGNDSRLTDARTPTAHGHAASDITSGTIATARLGSGTADATTYLRGDNTWAAPAGGGSSLLATTSYNPSTGTSFSTTSTTGADVNATNLVVTFTAPTSGRVLVRMSACCGIDQTGRRLLWCLRSGTSNVTDSAQSVREVNSVTNVGLGERGSYVALISSLTPGSSYTWKWGHYVSATATAYLALGVSTNYGPAIMEVWSS